MLRICSGCIFFLLVVVNLAAGKDENLIAGKQVEADAKLKKGDRLVGIYDKKNYLVEVREVKANKKLRIIWVESGDFDDDTSQTRLYYIGDATQTRRSRTSPLPETYRALDKNGDGQVGLYEWDRAKYAEFRKLDKNHDGLLTPQELTGKSTVAAATPAVASAAKEGESKDAKDMKEIPNPGNLLEYETKIGESFLFTVVGKTGGGVWGMGPYSTESDLAAVAVHAGVLKDGAAGPVKVTIVAPPDKFTGSVANGVTSVDLQESGPAFTVEAVKK